MNKTIKRKKENVVYKNKFATIYDDDVVFPNGKNGKYVRFMWNLDYGVAVLATLLQEEKIVLVKEYSYRQSAWGWNIPKGMGEKGIPPLEQAKNELEEESGLSTHDISFLFKLREIVDTKDGVFFYRARVDMENKTDKERDEGESISDVKFFTKDEALAMIHNGEISCYHTAVAILYWISEGNL